MILIEIRSDYSSAKIIARMEEGTDKSSGCWIWNGYIRNGYGTITILDQPFYLHHLAFKILKREIPKGLWVLHSCDNKRCWNPEHLFEGNHQANMDDMNAKGRGVTHPWKSGIDNCNATLTDEQIVEIRSTSGPQREIAKRYKVSQSTIWRIRHMITRPNAESLLFPEGN